MAKRSVLRRYDPAKANGTFVLRDIPKRFPLFAAAAMHVKIAMNKNCDRIRCERKDSVETGEWPVVFVFQEAAKRGWMRTSMGVAFPDEIQERIQYWPGAAFPAKENVNG